MATAFTIGTVGCQLLDTAFLPLMKSASAGSLAGVGMAVIMIMTYVGLKTKILIESMRAINAVPDAIMRWIGVGGAMAEGSHGHGRDAVGAMSAMSASQGGSWLKGAAERIHGGKRGGDVNERKGGELPDDPSPREEARNPKEGREETLFTIEAHLESHNR